MLLFTKKEFANEYAIWCNNVAEFIGELGFVKTTVGTSAFTKRTQVFQLVR